MDLIYLNSNLVHNNFTTQLEITSPFTCPTNGIIQFVLDSTYGKWAYAEVKVNNVLVGYAQNINTNSLNVCQSFRVFKDDVVSFLTINGGEVVCYFIANS